MSEKSLVWKVLELEQRIEELEVELAHYKAVDAESIKQCKKFYRENDRYRETLKKLSVLGNGERPGNSLGNQIALEALNDLHKIGETS